MPSKVGSATNADMVFRIGYEADLDTTKIDAQIRRFQREIDKAFGPRRINATSVIAARIKGQMAAGKTIPQIAGAIRQTSGGLAGYGAKALDSKKIQQKIKAIEKGLNQAGNAAKGFDNKLGLAFKRVALWGVASGVVYGTARAFSELARTIMDVDAATQRLKRLLPGTTQDYVMLQNEAGAMAKRYGVDIKDALGAMEGFAKKYKDQAVVVNLANEALMLANFSTAGVAQVTENLIATMAQYNLQVEESSRIVDSWAAVSANAKVSVDDLGDAAALAGKAAESAGVSFDEFNGIVAAVATATNRSGTDIGNSLKRMFERIIAPEGAKKLQGLGVQVFTKKEGKTVVRPFLDIVENARQVIAKATAESAEFGNKITQQISIAAAGARRWDQFLAVLKQYDNALLLAEKSSNSFGEATRQNAFIMDELDKKMESLKASAQDFATGLGQGGLKDAFKSVVVSAQVMLDLFGRIPGEINAILVPLGTLTLAAKGLSVGLEKLKWATVSTMSLLKWGAIIAGVVIAVSELARGIEYLMSSPFERAQSGFKILGRDALTLRVGLNDLQSKIIANNETIKKMGSTLEKIGRIEGVLGKGEEVSLQRQLELRSQIGGILVDTMKNNQGSTAIVNQALDIMTKQVMNLSRAAKDITFKNMKEDIDAARLALVKFNSELTVQKSVEYGKSLTETLKSISARQKLISAKANLEEFPLVGQSPQYVLSSAGKSKESTKLASDMKDFIEQIQDRASTMEVARSALVEAFGKSSKEVAEFDDKARRAVSETIIGLSLAQRKDVIETLQRLKIVQGQTFAQAWKEFQDLLSGRAGGRKRKPTKGIDIGGDGTGKVTIMMDELMQKLAEIRIQAKFFSGEIDVLTDVTTTYKSAIDDLISSYSKAIFENIEYQRALDRLNEKEEENENEIKKVKKERDKNNRTIDEAQRKMSALVDEYNRLRTVQATMGLIRGAVVPELTNFGSVIKQRMEGENQIAQERLNLETTIAEERMNMQRAIQNGEVAAANAAREAINDAEKGLAGLNQKMQDLKKETSIIGRIWEKMTVTSQKQALETSLNAVFNKIGEKMTGPLSGMYPEVEKLILGMMGKTPTDQIVKNTADIVNELVQIKNRMDVASGKIVGEPPLPKDKASIGGFLATAMPLIAASISGVTAGAGMTNAMGRRGSGGAIGGGIGAILGSFGGPVGQALGSTVGGFIGSLTDEKIHQSFAAPYITPIENLTDQMVDNTQAIREQTSTLDKIINAPSNFVLPAAAKLGGLYPGAQWGGNVKKSGLAYVHSGETVGSYNSVNIVVQGGGNDSRRTAMETGRVVNEIIRGQRRNTGVRARTM